MIKNKEKHQKIYIALSLLIFLMAGALHTWRLSEGWDIWVGPLMIPQVVSMLAVFVILAMLVMGIYHLSRK